jgi:hypothetical protein
MYSSTHSLTSALDGDEWSASRPGRFNPRERAPDTHWIGGWVGPRAVLDTVVTRKIANPRRESNQPARRPALYRLSYHGSELMFVTKLLLVFTARGLSKIQVILQKVKWLHVANTNCQVLHPECSTLLTRASEMQCL